MWRAVRLRTHLASLNTSEYVIEKLRPRKVFGCDVVPNETVKLLIKIQPRIFEEMMNVIYCTGVWPSTWRKARLVLIPKPNSPSYRPLSCLSSISKAAQFVFPFIQRAWRSSEFSPSQRSTAAARSIDVRIAWQSSWKSRMRLTLCRGTYLYRGFGKVAAVDAPSQMWA